MTSERRLLSEGPRAEGKIARPLQPRLLAPEGWRTGAGIPPDYQSKSLSEAGLVIVTSRGRATTVSADRIMFPIHNQRGSDHRLLAAHHPIRREPSI